MRSVFLLALSLLCFAADAQERRVVGYFAGWSVGRGFRVGDMRGDQLTHLNYAFAKVVDGRIAFIDRKAAIESFQQLRLLKEKYKHLKTMISVGGWADSDRFSDAAVSEESRKEFARSAWNCTGVRQSMRSRAELSWQTQNSSSAC